MIGMGDKERNKTPELIWKRICLNEVSLATDDTD
jgi:hypothetical protein